MIKDVLVHMSTPWANIIFQFASRIEHIHVWYYNSYRHTLTKPFHIDVIYEVSWNITAKTTTNFTINLCMVATRYRMFLCSNLGVLSLEYGKSTRCMCSAVSMLYAGNHSAYSLRPSVAASCLKHVRPGSTQTGAEENSVSIDVWPPVKNVESESSTWALRRVNTLVVVKDSSLWAETSSFTDCQTDWWIPIVYTGCIARWATRWVHPSTSTGWKRREESSSRWVCEPQFIRLLSHRPR